MTNGQFSQKLGFSLFSFLNSVFEIQYVPQYLNDKYGIWRGRLIQLLTIHCFLGTFWNKRLFSPSLLYFCRLNQSFSAAATRINGCTKIITFDWYNGFSKNTVLYEDIVKWISIFTLQDGYRQLFHLGNFEETKKQNREKDVLAPIRALYLF